MRTNPFSAGNHYNTTRTFDIFGDHEDHDDPANDDDDYTTARLVSSLER